MKTMKKNYIQPSLKIKAARTRQTMLAGSMTVGTTSITSGYADGKGRDDWDDDDLW